MAGGEKTSEAHRTVLASAKDHRVAVIGGPVLTPTAAGCRQALHDGVTGFCHALDSMGFRAWCEDTVRALADGAAGSADWSGPPMPASGFLAPAPATR